MMTAYLIGVLLWNLAVAKSELQLSQILHGELDLGRYEGKVDIGMLPERYLNMSAEDKKACYNFRRLLEQLRGSFSTGSHGIPSLDPYVINNILPVPINEPFLDGEIDIVQVTITGMQAFKIKQIELRLDTIRSDFIVTVPLLVGVGSFQANLVLSGLFPISFNGKLRVNLENVTVEGAIGGSENITQPKNFYTLNTLHANFHAENVKIRIDGLNLDGDILELLQSTDSFDSNITLEPYKKLFNNYVAHAILRQLNDILHNFSVKQVKAYLLAR